MQRRRFHVQKALLLSTRNSVGFSKLISTKVTSFQESLLGKKQAINMKNIAFTGDKSTRKIKHLSVACCLMKTNFYSIIIIIK